MQKRIKLVLIFAAAFFIVQPAISEAEAGLWDSLKGSLQKKQQVM